MYPGETVRRRAPLPVTPKPEEEWNYLLPRFTALVILWWLVFWPVAVGYIWRQPMSRERKGWWTLASVAYLVVAGWFWTLRQS